MDEVEVCTDSVEYFCRKNHKAPAILVKNCSKLVENQELSFDGL
jgi:hypothetical protein